MPKSPTKKPSKSTTKGATPIVDMIEQENEKMAQDQAQLEKAKALELAEALANEEENKCTEHSQNVGSLNFENLAKEQTAYREFRI